MTAQTRSGAELVVRALETAKVDTVFGIPGVHTLALYDALLKSGMLQTGERILCVVPESGRAMVGFMMLEVVT